MRIRFKGVRQVVTAALCWAAAWGSIVAGCSPVVVGSSGKEKTSQCEDMDEACNDAQRFRGEYAQLSDEDKRDMKEILIAMESQCEEAALRCKKSQTQKQR